MSDQREHSIRERAYALWEESGSQHGRHDEHWHQAVREIDGEAGTPVKPARKTAAKPATRLKPGPKPKVAAKADAAPAPVATAVGKAREAADKVVATVKRATKGSATK